MLTYAILIALVLLAWIVFKPGWLPARSPVRTVTKKVTREAEQIKGQSGKWIDWFRVTRLKWKERSQLGTQLKDWAMNEDLVNVAGFTKAEIDLLADFQDWIRGLSVEEADALGRELSAFCDRQGVKVRWLLADGGRGDMQAALAALGLYYGLAVRERMNALPAAALRAWSDAPLAKENREFGNQLYVKLVDAGRISVPAGLLLAPEKERLAHQVRVIQAEMEKDPEGLLSLAAQVVEERRQARPKRSQPVSPKPAETPAPEQVAAQGAEAAL